MKYAVSVVAYGWVAMEADSVEQAEKLVYRNACKFDLGELLNGEVADVVNDMEECETKPYTEWEKDNGGDCGDKGLKMKLIAASLDENLRDLMDMEKEVSDAGIWDDMGDTYDAIERMNGRYDATLWTLYNLGFEVDIKDCKHSIQYGTQKISADRVTKTDA